MTYSKQQIGRVHLWVPEELPREHYADKAEDTLHELFTGKDIERKRQTILQNNPSWALYYHLSPRRGTLVRWYEFIQCRGVTSGHRSA